MTNMGSLPTTKLGLLLVVAIWGLLFDASITRIAAQDAKIPAPTAAPEPAGTAAPSKHLTHVHTVAAECPMKCENGSVCKVGKHDYSKHPREPGNGAPFTFLQHESQHGWYCECPDGFTGLRCNRKYVECPLPTDAVAGRSDSNTTSNHGNHFCYHGGSCIDGMTDGSFTDASGNDQRFCDCSKAHYNGVPYFGKYCEIEGARQCGGEDSTAFCTAQGKCKDDAEKKANPCECLQGHRGPHCEFMTGSVPECTLACGHTLLHEDGTFEQSLTGGRGKCTLGMKDFESARYRDFWSSHDGNYQYCKCPKGWFGDNCEVPGIECGSAHCFNGASCLESTNNNGQSTYACDCKTAGHDGKNYAGQYCENVESGACTGSEQDANGHLFCTNGGTCKDPNNPHLGCDCPEGQFGPACEYHREEDSSCNLTCMNGGECRAGKKDNSMIEQLGKGLDDYLSTHHSELFEHCVCPSNYFGIQCEHKLEICPGGDHICLHGSECIPHNEGQTHGSTYFTCDCDSAFDALDRYAGKFCQYSSTDICTKNGQPGMGKASFAFCVNNGVCKARVEDGEDPPGCDCPEGFKGDRCEYLIDEDDDAKKIVGDDDFSSFASDFEFRQRSSGNTIIGLSVAIMILVVVLVGFILRALFCPVSNSVDVQAALDAEEATNGYSDNASMATSCSQDINMSGIMPVGSGDASLEDIEVDDYVNNDSSVLTAREMTNVQVV